MRLTLNTSRRGFTLVEIMIVVAIIALLASIAVPNFLRSRKRTQATHILEDLRVLDSAFDLHRIERPTEPLSWDAVKRYIKTGTRLYDSNYSDLLGNSFEVNQADPTDWKPRVSASTFSSLDDVAPTDFWGAYAATP